MKVALFVFPQWPDMKPDVKNENDAKYTTMVRITEWSEVKFQDRNEADLLCDKIEYVNRSIAEAKKEKNDQLARLEHLLSVLSAELVLQS